MIPDPEVQKMDPQHLEDVINGKTEDGIIKHCFQNQDEDDDFFQVNYKNQRDSPSTKKKDDAYF